MSFEQIKTKILNFINLFDCQHQWLPPGEYYFVVKKIENNIFNGVVKNSEDNDIEYNFLAGDFVRMMANAQAKLARNNNEDHPFCPVIDNQQEGNRVLEYLEDLESTMLEEGNLQSIIENKENLGENNLSRLDSTVGEESQQTANQAETNEQEQEEKCMICLDSLDKSASTTRELHCNHFYHENCIELWFVNDNRCPICRDTTGRENRIIRENPNHTIPINEVEQVYDVEDDDLDQPIDLSYQNDNDYTNVYNATMYGHSMHTETNTNRNQGESNMRRRRVRHAWVESDSSLEEYDNRNTYVISPRRRRRRRRRTRTPPRRNRRTTITPQRNTMPLRDVSQRRINEYNTYYSSNRNLIG